MKEEEIKIIESYLRQAFELGKDSIDNEIDYDWNDFAQKETPYIKPNCKYSFADCKDDLINEFQADFGE